MPWAEVRTALTKNSGTSAPFLLALLIKVPLAAQGAETLINLDDADLDTDHRRCFEMPGNWSFGDSFE